MIRVLVVVLAVLVLGGGALEAGDKRRPDPIAVHAHVGQQWRGPTRQTVRGFNRAMPKRVPKLRASYHPGRPCNDLPKGKGKGIHVCDGEGNWMWGNHRHAKVGIDFAQSPADFRQALCHELMHAVTGVEDSEIYGLIYPKPETSCVWGDVRDKPGPWDARVARKAWR